MKSPTKSIAGSVSAGSIFANLLGAHLDLFDLSVPLPPYCLYVEPYYDEHGNPFNDMIPDINPALKMVVNNYSLGGIPGEFFSKTVPTVVVGKEQAELFRRDPSMQAYMNKALLADNLDAAMDFAYKATGTDKVIIFDNAEERFVHMPNVKDIGMTAMIHYYHKNLKATVRKDEIDEALGKIAKILRQNHTCNGFCIGTNEGLMIERVDALGELRGGMGGVGDGLIEVTGVKRIRVSNIV